MTLWGDLLHFALEFLPSVVIYSCLSLSVLLLDLGVGISGRSTGLRSVYMDFVWVHTLL